MRIKHQSTKTLKVRNNGRSSDAVAPNFIYGCLGGCMSSYCYVSRYNNHTAYVNDNTEDILRNLDQWADAQAWPKKPNQVDGKYYCIDIGCSTDVPLMQKHYNWQHVFTYFNDHPRLKSTFATKYPTMFNPLSYNLNKDKHRIRVSLMPQRFSDVLEPKTDKIAARLLSIPHLAQYMEVHINLSPIIVYDGWLKEYELLFQQLKDHGINTKSECIFLTYNDRQYNQNSKEVNEMLWRPELQEYKNSHYADNNIRYKWEIKKKFIDEFKEIYGKFFNLQDIRYIF